MSKIHIWTVAFISMQLFVTAEWIPNANQKNNKMSDRYKIGNSLYINLLIDKRRLYNSIIKKKKSVLICCNLKSTLIATGVRPEDCEGKRAKSRAVISCCVFNTYARLSVIIVCRSLGK